MRAIRSFLLAALVDLPDSILAALDDVLQGWSRGRLRDAPLALALLVPAFAVLGAFGVLPLLYSVYMSGLRFEGAGSRFVGLANHAEALQSEAFWNGFLVTVYYAVGTVPATMAFSFVVANCLFRIPRFQGLLRTFYFLPFVTSVVAAAMIWRVLLDPTFGMANVILEGLGLSPQMWLLEPRGVLHIISGGAISAGVGPSLALCCIILFEIWHSSGFMIVLLLAGLTAVPRELEDAARIDGANWLQLARNVTLPMISPTLFFLAIVSAIKSFQAFNSFYALTGNGRGPLDTTQNMTVYIFANFYEYGRLGYGAAVATLLCLAIVVLTIVQWRVLGRRVHYQ